MHKYICSIRNVIEAYARRSWIVGALLLFVVADAHAGGLVELNSQPVAPDFELSDVGGNTLRLSDHRGDVVLVNFWASWCAPCRAEMPSLERLKQSINSPDFHILAINIGETRQAISKFYFSVSPPLSFKLLMDIDSSASQYWPMRGLPMTFLIDRQGRVTHVSHGAQRWDTHAVTDVIRELQSQSLQQTTDAKEEKQDQPNT